jgi:hypothetical protein
MKYITGEFSKRSRVVEPKSLPRILFCRAVEVTGPEARAGTAGFSFFSFKHGKTPNFEPIVA